MSRKNRKAKIDQSPFNQIVVFRSVLIREDEHGDFEEFCLKQLGARMQYLDQYVTEPGCGRPGGRHDVLARIHDDDIPKYSLARLQHENWRGTWWEDHVDHCIYHEQMSDRVVERSIIPAAIRRKYPKSW